MDAEVAGGAACATQGPGGGVGRGAGPGGAGGTFLHVVELDKAVALGDALVVADKEAAVEGAVGLEHLAERSVLHPR